MKFIYSSPAWKILLERIEMERQAYTGDEDLPPEQVEELESDVEIAELQPYYQRRPITRQHTAPEWAAILVKDYLVSIDQLDEEDADLLDDPVAEAMWDVMREFESFAMSLISPNFAKQMAVNAVESLGGFDLCFQADPRDFDRYYNSF